KIYMSDSVDSYDHITDVLANHAEGRKIALCSSSFKGQGGDCRVIQQQARDLADQGYEVTIFTLEADIEAPEGVELEVVGSCIPLHFQRLTFCLSFVDLTYLLPTVTR
ncbi:MAG: hypothetical protein ABEI86_14605, partial [Halobacteriaceae archaeon]